MDLSGLIFVALALVWGVVLIPKALRAHDDAARIRSVEASSDDARVLPRGDRTAPARSRQTHAAAETVTTTAPTLGAVIARQRHLAGAAARRRRQVLALLVLLTTATGAASVADLFLPWAAAVPGVLVIGFLAFARVLVKREHSAWEATLRQLRERDVPETQTSDSQPSPTPLQEPELYVVARNDQGVAVVSDSEDTSAFDAAVLATSAAAPAGTLWDPLPVTLPTYVTKPRASRSVRTIDLNSPGVSSSGHDATDTALAAEAAAGPEEQEPPAQQAVGS